MGRPAHGSFVTEASASYESTLRTLGADRDPPAGVDPKEAGRRAALVTLTAAVWRGQLGPLLEARDVQRLLGVGTRQAVSDLRARGRILAVREQSGRVLYPAFQFDPHGRPLPGLADVLTCFSDVGVSGWTVASWFTTPQGSLAGATPSARLSDGDAIEVVVRVARRAAARLKR